MRDFNHIEIAAQSPRLKSSQFELTVNVFDNEEPTHEYSKFISSFYVKLPIMSS
jgi:hypothetical protein